MAPLTHFADVVNQVLALYTEGLPRILRLPAIGGTALLIVILAGVSEAVGESVVLFANRVGRVRFLLSLLISALLFVFTFLFQAASIYAVARFGFDSEVSLATVTTVVGLSYAPRLFGLLAFLPYFGPGLAVLLTTWSVLAMVRGVAGGLELGPWQAAATVAMGALLLAVLRRSVGLPLYWAAHWLRRVGAGVEELITDPEEFSEMIEETAVTLVDVPVEDWAKEEGA
ncbi:MAG TPA: hypothetical protein VFD39_01530 [Trueperaceae bacterium]|nr:hypothetical protein [Trueperaceae bacterium]